MEFLLLLTKTVAFVKSGHLSTELFQAKLSQVPPNVHLAELNPHLDLKQDRFAVTC